MYLYNYFQFHNSWFFSFWFKHAHPTLRNDQFSLIIGAAPNADLFSLTTPKMLKIVIILIISQKSSYFYFRGGSIDKYWELNYIPRR